MAPSTYNIITMVLVILLLLTLLLMLTSFVAMLVRWKTPKRRVHAVRFFAALVTVPCMIGLQQAVLWLVFLPSLGRQQMAEIDAARTERLAETSLVGVGDPAPQCALITADDKTFSLPSNGRVTLVNFFATWCGPCRLELPHIERIWQAHKDNDRFNLLVIGREETTEAVREYRDQYGYSFPIAADPDRAVYSLFATESIPRTLVVSAEGQIVYSQAGFLEEDMDKLEAVLEEQLSSVR